MLSTPIQFMSLTEKRTRQMKGMGIDETDISDVPTTSSKRSKSDQPSLSSSGAANGKTSSSSGTQSAAKTSSSSQLQGATAADKKDKKGTQAANEG